jgi:hypothetical protein
VSRFSLVAEEGGGAVDLGQRRWGTAAGTWALMALWSKHGRGEIGAASDKVGDGRSGDGGRRNVVVGGACVFGRGGEAMWLGGMARWRIGSRWE